MAPRVSVICTTYRALDCLALCLDSLAGPAAELGWEIIVYGDGAPAGLADLLRRFPSVRSELNPVNAGICPALDRAAALAGGDHLLFINDDMVFDADGLRRLDSRLAPDLVLSFRNIEPPGLAWGSARWFLQADCGPDPARFDRAAFAALCAAQARDLAEPGVNYPFCVPAAAFRAAGGIDLRYPGPLHDPDLFYRLALAGLRLERRHDLLCYHFSGRSLRDPDQSRRASARWRALETLGRRLFIAKWGEKPHYRFGELPRPGAAARGLLPAWLRKLQILVLLGIERLRRG